MTPSCAWCGAPFPAGARRDSITCSKRCRQARHRFQQPNAPAVAPPSTGPLRLAYADPPYPGLARRCYEGHPDYAGEVDHEELVAGLVRDFPDGWALSTSVDALVPVLRLCPPAARVAVWVRGERPAAAWTPLHAWEPVIYTGGRAKLSAGAARRVDVLFGSPGPGRLADPRRVVGAKPAAFCRWLFELLGAAPGDELVDLYPGSGGVARAWEVFGSRTAAGRVASRGVALRSSDTSVAFAGGTRRAFLEDGYRRAEQLDPSRGAVGRMRRRRPSDASREYSRHVAARAATDRSATMTTAPMAKHPRQPIVLDARGVARFKANPLVKHLLDHGGIDMNDLAAVECTDDDRTQFAELIGHSVSGAGDLHYFDREVLETADAEVEAKLFAVDHPATEAPAAPLPLADQIARGSAKAAERSANAGPPSAEPLVMAPTELDKIEAGRRSRELPLWPTEVRCRTCRHWTRADYGGGPEPVGECAQVQAERLRAGKASGAFQRGEAAKVEDSFERVAVDVRGLTQASIEVGLVTREDFGCVLWEGFAPASRGVLNKVSG